MKQTTTFTNLIRRFVAFSAIAQSENKLNLSYPNLSVFPSGSVQVALSPDKFQDLKDVRCAIAYFKIKNSHPIYLPLEGLEDAFGRFLTFNDDNYLRFYPLGFYWEYGKFETGGLESGETVDQLQEILKMYERVPISA